MFHREDMRGYQHSGVQFIKDVRRCALFVEPGLGKTVTALTAIRDMQLDIELGRVLVVGPPRVVKKTWPDEIKNWSHTKAITWTSLQAPTALRKRRMKEATDIHLISADLVPWLDRETCGRHDYDMIVIDESTLFKSQSAARWKAMRRLVSSCRYVVLLTGTPSAQGLADLWGQLYLVDQGARLGRDEKTFKERYFDEAWGEHARPEAKSFAEAKIKERIEDVVFTLLGADYLKLPPLIENKIMVEMEPDQLKAYKKFVREYVMELEQGGAINAVSAGALTQKLQQIANGIVLDKDGVPHELHTIKLEALDNLVEEAAGQPMLVVYSHRADIARIRRKYPHAVLLGNNPQTQTDWNEGRIQMLLMHPKSGAHGLNIQHGGSIIVWFGNTWSAELHQQLIKRLHRSGQKASAVICHYILCAGTIDERIMKSLETLGEDQARFLAGLKRIILDEYKEAT